MLDSWYVLLPLGFCGMLGLLYFFQHKLMYFPDVPVGRRTFMLPPSEVGLPDPENVFLPMKDGIKVNLWLFLQPNSKYVPTVIFFHGNAGNMSFRNENFKALYSQCEVNVLAVEYRGFGLSDGVPGQASLISDAVEVFDWISAREEIDPTRLVVLGRSIGGAVAIHLAQKRPQIAGLILENTFTTVSELIDRLMPNLRYFKFLLTNPWRNEDIVPSLSMPVLFLCSQKDEMIPEEMMKRLHEKFGGNDKLVVFFAQANHMNAHMFPEYHVYVDSFLKRR